MSGGRLAMVDPSMILQGVINGLVLSGVYLLISIGLNLLYGVMGIVNFAHGEFLMIGMYILYWFSVWMKGISPYLFILGPVAGVLVLAILTYLLMIGPTLDRPHLTQLLITASLSVVLQNLALLLWTSDYRGIPIEITVINIGPITLTFERIICIVAAYLISIACYFVLQKTKFGYQIRAVAQDKEAAMLVGINTRKIFIVTFALSGVLVGFASALFAPIYYVHPQVGITFGLVAYIIIVLGGLGSFEGAVLGSIIVGVTQGVIGVITSLELAMVLVFSVFIFVVFVKPQGIFGGR